MDSTCFRGQYDDFLEKSGLANKNTLSWPIYTYHNTHAMTTSSK